MIVIWYFVYLITLETKKKEYIIYLWCPLSIRTFAFRKITNHEKFLLKNLVSYFVGRIRTRDQIFYRDRSTFSSEIKNYKKKNFLKKNTMQD